MSKKTIFAAASAAFLTLGAPLMAEGIMIKDAYVRATTPSSPTGAAFMVLMNHSDTDDRLIAAESGVAKRVELHSHTEDTNGVMRMGEIEGGISLPAGGMHHMKRGGDHVMLMGLNQPLAQGSEITVTLTFEKAGVVEVIVPVDHERKPAHGSKDHADHSNHGD